MDLDSKDMRLGKTGIEAGKCGFGCLPLQRVNENEAIKLVETAIENNIVFFDTARGYKDSEKKLGLGIKKYEREKINIATKSQAITREQLIKDIYKSLDELQCGYIDVFQFHNPPFCPHENDGNELYETVVQFKQKGLIRHIGITSHNYEIAKQAIYSGEYETIQFPFSYISSEKEIEIARLCGEHDIGFLAMKALAGGLISDINAAYCYIKGFENVLPLWGIQKLEELYQFINLNLSNMKISDKMIQNIENDRKTLGNQFCRGCGYCMPCPKGIEINNCARISLMLRKSDIHALYAIDMRKKMNKINECIGCGLCKEKCPYKLDIPKLLRTNLNDYLNILNGETKINMGDKNLTNEERMALHYPVIKKYLSSTLSGWSCVEYFKINDYKRIAIYAINEFSELMYLDLKRNSSKDIEYYFFDKNSKKVHFEEIVSDVDELCKLIKNKEIDCVVICSLVNEIQIRSELCSIGVPREKLVSIAEVVFSNE